MNIGLYLEVLIGLAFTFALFSLLCSGLNESIASFFNRRGRMLEKGLQALTLENEAEKFDFKTFLIIVYRTLTNRENILNTLFDFFRISPKKTGKTSVPTLSEDILNHSIIRGQSETGRIPSQISSMTFATVLIDILLTRQEKSEDAHPLFWAINSIPKGSFKSSLKAIYKETGEDIEGFSARVESWYDDGMDRIAGWYKRKTKWNLLLIGMIVAVGFNVDAIYLTKNLYKDSAFRSAIILQAEATKLDSVGLEKNAIVDIKAAISELSLPIGWSEKEITLRLKMSPKPKNEGQTIGKPDAPNIHPDVRPPSHARLADTRNSEGPHPLAFSDYLKIISGSLFGWIVSAYAFSFGAPFWFSIMRSALSIRGAISKKEKANPTAITISQTGESAGSTPTTAAQQNAAQAPLKPANTFEITGLTDVDVADIQKALGLKGSGITKTFDANTRILIREAQRRFGLPENGILSPKLAELILKHPSI